MRLGDLKFISFSSKLSWPSELASYDPSLASEGESSSYSSYSSSDEEDSSATLTVFTKTGPYSSALGTVSGAFNSFLRAYLDV
jgi:hypothetical protein